MVIDYAQDPKPPTISQRVDDNIQGPTFGPDRMTIGARLPRALLRTPRRRSCSRSSAYRRRGPKHECELFRTSCQLLNKSLINLGSRQIGGRCVFGVNPYVPIFAMVDYGTIVKAPDHQPAGAPEAAPAAKDCIRKRMLNTKSVGIDQ